MEYNLRNYKTAFIVPYDLIPSYVMERITDAEGKQLLEGIFEISKAVREGKYYDMEDVTNNLQATERVETILARFQDYCIKAHINYVSMIEASAKGGRTSKKDTFPSTDETP